MSDRTLTESMIPHRDLQIAFRRAELQVAIRISHARRFSSESPLHASSLGSLATSSPRIQTLTRAPGRVPPAQTGPGNWTNSSNQGVRHTTVEEPLQQNMSLLPVALVQTPNGTANPAATVAPVKQKLKKPMTTVLSLLPKTTYKEANGAEGTQDILAYLKVQRELLRYLGVRTADALTPQQACQWTESILPDKNPRP